MICALETPRCSHRQSWPLETHWPLRSESSAHCLSPLVTQWFMQTHSLQPLAPGTFRPSKPMVWSIPALIPPYTPMHTQNREELERSWRRQGRLSWLGTGHGQPSKLSSQLFMCSCPFYFLTPLPSVFPPNYLNPSLVSPSFPPKHPASHNIPHP